MLSRTKTWSVPTSPRNPYKLCDELKLLKQKFENRVWNKESQLEFAAELSKSDFFEGSASAKYSDFTARDRVNRSPKTFGFIRLDNNRKIEFTSAGNQVALKEGLEDLFLRQMLKWQYPSPNHDGAVYQNFRIKPFLEMLRLVKELEGLSKKEMAIFGVTLIDYRNYERTKIRIQSFRDALEKTIGKRNRQALEQKTHLEIFEDVYADEVGSGNISIRQGGSENIDPREFLKTKMRNAQDYADSAFRYFRATGLFSLSSRNYRLKIIDTKLETVNTILTRTNRAPEPFADSGAFLDYLGDNHLPKLPDDDEPMLRSYLARLVVRLGWEKTVIPFIKSIQELQKMDYLELKELKPKLEAIEQNSVLQKQISDLQSYKYYDDIMETFDKIRDRKDIDIPDKPLFFEWNVWRAMSMLDDGDIHANLKFDVEGKPFSGAPSKTADIVCEYRDFVLVVEVTLMSGHKQYETEGEPVARHVADIRKKFIAVEDKRPVFGLFIALQISEATAAHFFIARQTNIAFYGGCVDIVPFGMNGFLKVLKKAKMSGGVKSATIRELIGKANDAAKTASDEKDWQVKIEQTIESWAPPIFA